jgi:hypothetical protein
MQDTERKAFDEILAEIFAAIDKPLGEAQKAVFWKALRDLGIMEFARIRDLLVQEYRQREEPPRKFTVGDIWTAKRKLRAAAPAESTTPVWTGDVWDIVANQQLHGHISRSMARDPQCYGRGATAHGMKVLKTPNADASPQFVRAINTLVAFKNQWAQLMRDSAVDGGVPGKDQRESWDNCMRMAEEAIALERAQAA